MSATLARPVHHELLVKKSRFLACVEPLADREAALERVAGLRAAHPGAAHVCWALLAGGQSAAQDDGEPSGTAGRPMLEVLRHQDLEGVLATVVRYFGGIKLGAGGLVRAYTDAVAQALTGAERVPRVRLAELRCRVPYALEGLVRREAERAAVQLLDVAHGHEVTLHLRLPEPQAAPWRAALSEAGQGRVLWLDEHGLPIPLAP